MVRSVYLECALIVTARQKSELSGDRRLKEAFKSFEAIIVSDVLRQIHGSVKCLRYQIVSVNHSPPSGVIVTTAKRIHVKTLLADVRGRNRSARIDSLFAS